jgi:hypothetical protein
LFLLFLLLLSIIYIVNLPVVRPRSCRVIYYFDTPALGRRHQSFGRVTFRLKYLDQQKSNWCKLNFFGFLTQSAINTRNFNQKRCYMREIWFFKDDNWILPANRFREETSPNYIPKHLNWYPSFYFNNLAPLSQRLKISCKAISPK